MQSKEPKECIRNIIIAIEREAQGRDRCGPVFCFARIGSKLDTGKWAHNSRMVMAAYEKNVGPVEVGTKLDEPVAAGYDMYRNEWYVKILEDGRQVWAEARNGNIFEGGINDIPNPWDPATGLKKSRKESIT